MARLLRALALQFQRKIVYKNNEGLDSENRTNIITPNSQKLSFHFVNCNNRRIWIRGNIVNLFFESCEDLEIWFFNIFGKLEILRSNGLAIEGESVPTIHLEYTGNTSIKNKRINPDLIFKLDHCDKIAFNRRNIATNAFINNQIIDINRLMST